MLTWLSWGVFFFHIFSCRCRWTHITPWLDKVLKLSHATPWITRSRGLSRLDVILSNLKLGRQMHRPTAAVQGDGNLSNTDTLGSKLNLWIYRSSNVPVDNIACVETKPLKGTAPTVEIFCSSKCKCANHWFHISLLSRCHYSNGWRYLTEFRGT